MKPFEERRSEPLTVLVVLVFAHVASAQTADDYRGGWRTDAGEAHTYQFSNRGEEVRGVYCTYCADATTLAFVNGTFGPGGLTFQVAHVDADGRTEYTDRAGAGACEPRRSLSTAVVGKTIRPRASPRPFP